MGEIDNQIKKQIYLKVDKTYLKGVNKNGFLGEHLVLNSGHTTTKFE